MLSMSLPWLTALGLGCADVSEAVDDAATVEVGAESLRAVEIERSMSLGIDRIPACLDFSATLPSSNTTVILSNSSTGCSLTVEQPAMVLLDEQAIERAREQSGDFDVDGIRGASLEVQQLELSTAESEPLELSRYVDALTVSVDGEVLLDRVASSELQADTALTRELPTSLLDKLKTALKANEAATADVVIALWLSNDGLVDLPETLRMRVVLQPGLRVNIVDAVF
jgi:hypothetical protein